MYYRIRTLALSALAMLAICVPANAAPIDFTGVNWNGANGQTSFTVSGNTATADTLGSTLTHTLGRGLGIWSLLHSDPEVGLFDRLRLTFGLGTVLDSFTVNSLFWNDPAIFTTIIERGNFSINGGPTMSFQASNTNLVGGPGQLTVSFGPTVVNTLSLWINAPLGSTAAAFSDFHLGQVNQVVDPGQPGQPVPEPASMMLLGTGLIVLTRLRKRKNAQQPAAAQ